MLAKMRKSFTLLCPGEKILIRLSARYWCQFFLQENCTGYSVPAGDSAESGDEDGAGVASGSLCSITGAGLATALGLGLWAGVIEGVGIGLLVSAGATN